MTPQLHSIQSRYLCSNLHLINPSFDTLCTIIFALHNHGDRENSLLPSAFASTNGHVLITTGSFPPWDASTATTSTAIRRSRKARKSPMSWGVDFQLMPSIGVIVLRFTVNLRRWCGGCLEQHDSNLGFLHGCRSLHGSLLKRSEKIPSTEK